MSSSDFLLFPPNSSLPSKMLAVDAARAKHSYFQPMTMDPSLVDMFSFPVDGVPPYAPNGDFSRVPPSYYDASVFDSDVQKISNFPSMPATPPSISTSQSGPQIPAGSAASGPSIASGPSSAIGSPYSGPAQVFQENWVNTNHGLGLQAAVMNDLFANEYMGNPAEPDGLYSEKFPSTFVGMWFALPVVSSCTNPPCRSFTYSARTIWPQLHPDHLLS